MEKRELGEKGMAEPHDASDEYGTKGCPQESDCCTYCSDAYFAKKDYWAEDMLCCSHAELFEGE